LVYLEILDKQIIVLPKLGVIGFTKSIAKELATRNITANCIAPGYIITDMTEALPDKIKEDILSKVPLKRPGNPIDVAKSVIFLCSEYADYITGQTIAVDGGMAM
jgi:3-oxoacyl-[acyl-carrier protein] reductase